MEILQGPPSRAINLEKIISPAISWLCDSDTKSFLYYGYFFLQKWQPLSCCVGLLESKLSTGDRWNIHSSAKGVVLDVYLAGAGLGLCTWSRL